MSAPLAWRAERDARKAALEARIKVFEQMEEFCYQEQRSLKAELNLIEDEEGKEEEREWQARMNR